MAEGTIIPPTLPSGFCFTTWQALFNYVLGHATVSIPDGDLNFVISEEEPAAADRGKIWIRHDADGAPDRLYKYFNGEWLWPHELPPSGNIISLWQGSASELTTFDGGDSDTLGDSSGPMWEIVTAFAGRFAVGVGTIPDALTAVTALSTGGAGQATLTTPNLPEHSHTYDITEGRGASGDGGAAWTGDGTEHDTGETGEGTPFNIVPPFVGVYFIKRTSRIYRKV